MTVTPPPDPPRPPVATDAEQLALLIDTVREYAIYTLDTRGNVRTWNAGAERIKGYRADEIVGQHFSLMFTPEDREARKPWRLLAEAEATGQARDEGWRMRKDGTRFWASIVLTAIRDRAGELRGFGKVSRDETERHAIEERNRQHAVELEARVAERTRELLAQADALRLANTDLEQFAHIASHDLKEPVRMVGLHLQKLARSAGPRLTEDERRYVRYATEGAERMRLLIDDLMQFNRVERASQAREPIDSAQALRSALDNLADPIATSGAEIVVGELPAVRAHPGQLTQVFQNLIQNGIKYGPKRHPRITVGCARDGDAWRFSVADNGIGIDSEHHQRIFALFQRLHDRSTYPGTGIGLAICKKIVEQHGGRIWVESTPGRGSTFHFTMPGLG
jgi:PAS domain S-box-containing protein